MRLNDKIKLAVYNLLHRKKTTIQCIIMTTVIMLLVFVCSFFITTLSLQLSDNLDNYASKNYITIEHVVYEGDRDSVLLNQKAQDELKERFKTVDSINYYKTFSPLGLHPTHSQLIVDGATYQGDGTNGEYIWWQPVIKNIEVPTFSKNTITEFSKKFADEKLIKYGRDIQNPNEILFPEEFFIAFDISPDLLLNADKVSLAGIFADVKVVGITNSNISMLDVDENGNRDIFAEIVIFAEESVVFEYVINDETVPANIYSYQKIELNGADEANEIVEYIDNLLGENYWARFGNHSKQNQLDLISKLLTFTKDIITVLIGAIGIALIVFLYSVLDYGAKQKGAYYGMMRAMGIKSTVSISLIEMIIITILSMILCLILSIITVYSLSGLVISFSFFTRYTISISIKLFAIIFFITFVLVAILNLILSLLTAKKVDNKSIVSALRS